MKIESKLERELHHQDLCRELVVDLYKLLNYINEEWDSLSSCYSNLEKILSKWNGKYRLHIHEFSGDFNEPILPESLKDVCIKLSNNGMEDIARKMLDLYKTSFMNFTEIAAVVLDLLDKYDSYL